MSPRNSLGLSRSVKTECKGKREKKDDDYNCKGFNFRYKILKNMNSSISCHLLSIRTFWVRIQLSYDQMDILDELPCLEKKI